MIDQINDRAAFLRLAETLTAFLSRLRSNADTLDVAERQRIVRLVVKEVLVGENDITIRPSIPPPSGPPSNGRSASTGDPSYLLCKGSDYSEATIASRQSDGGAVPKRGLRGTPFWLTADNDGHRRDGRPWSAIVT